MHYQGSCHCGRVRFEVATEVPITEACDCNCSMCRRRGGLLWFGPATALDLATPRENLGSYKFNRHHIDHHFCPNCGVSPFSEGVDKSGAKTVAVNLRALPGVDLARLKIVQIDGASF